MRAANAFKNVLAVLNTASGTKEGRNIYASSLQRYFLDKGVVHHTIIVPHVRDFTEILMNSHMDFDLVVCCGGDGTISSVVNVFSASRSISKTRPILIIPSGLQNSIASSFGISSADSSVTCFRTGRVSLAPVWSVTVGGQALRYVVSTISVGAYANSVRRMHEINRVLEERVALPMIREKFKAAVAFTTIMSEPAAVDVRLRRKDGATSQFTSPVKSLVLSQMSMQHSGYSLTPRANFTSELLCATVADNSASRLRMWHLLRKEAKMGGILCEDGVHEFSDVVEVTLQTGDAVDLLLDGEFIKIPAGTVVAIEKVPDFKIPFLVI